MGHRTEAFPRSQQPQCDSAFKIPGFPRQPKKVNILKKKRKKKVVSYIGKKSCYKIQTVEHFYFIDFVCLFVLWGVNGSGWQGYLPPNT